MHNRFDYMGPNPFFNWLIPLVVIIVIGLSIYMISKNTNGKKENKDSVLDILDKRYARGEIDEEEYLKKKKTFENK